MHSKCLKMGTQMGLVPLRGIQSSKFKTKADKLSRNSEWCAYCSRNVLVLITDLSVLYLAEDGTWMAIILKFQQIKKRIFEKEGAVL